MLLISFESNITDFNSNKMYKIILNLLIWLLFLGGLFGFAVGMIKFFGSGAPVEYGVMGIGGGFYLLAAGICIYFRDQLADG